MPRTLVALATYNEIENLPGLVDEILRVLPDADVLVVDDNSPDGTGKWCDSHAHNRAAASLPASPSENWGLARQRLQRPASRSMTATMFSSRSTPIGAMIRSICHSC